MKPRLLCRSHVRSGPVPVYLFCTVGRIRDLVFYHMINGSIVLSCNNPLQVVPGHLSSDRVSEPFDVVVTKPEDEDPLTLHLSPLQAGNLS